MGNAVFPSLAGLKWDVGMSPQFSTRVQRSVSGNELRANFMAYPLWMFKLAYEVLRDDVANNELKQIAGFFLLRRGMFDSFLYTHPSDSTAVLEPFGTGNGVLTQFQLTRSYGGFAEPVQNVVGVPVVKVAGVTKIEGTDYTRSSAGLITFTAAPTGALTWSGSFYYRVRFLHDAADFNEFLKDLWDLKKIEFVGAVGNKV